MTNQPNPEVAAQQRIEQIAKLNAKKAWGHIDSAASHCAELLKFYKLLQAERDQHAACLREVREKLTSPEGTTVRDVLDALAIIDRIQGEKK